MLPSQTDAPISLDAVPPWLTRLVEVRRWHVDFCTESLLNVFDFLRAVKSIRVTSLVQKARRRARRGRGERLKIYTAKLTNYVVSLCRIVRSESVCWRLGRTQARSIQTNLRLSRPFAITNGLSKLGFERTIDSIKREQRGLEHISLTAEVLFDTNIFVLNTFCRFF